VRSLPADILILGSYADSQSVEFVTHNYLASEPRVSNSVLGTFEQIVLIVAHAWQFSKKTLVDMYVTCGARAAAPAKSQEFVDSSVANGFHQGEAGLEIQMDNFAFARGNDNFRHSES
jgi:hypothetical protein